MGAGQEALLGFVEAALKDGWGDTAAVFAAASRSISAFKILPCQILTKIASSICELQLQMQRLKVLLLVKT